jgi:hypothetical protein
MIFSFSAFARALASFMISSFSSISTKRRPVNVGRMKKLLALANGDTSLLCERVACDPPSALAFEGDGRLLLPLRLSWVFLFLNFSTRRCRKLR